MSYFLPKGDYMVYNLLAKVFERRFKDKMIHKEYVSVVSTESLRQFQEHENFHIRFGETLDTLCYVVGTQAKVPEEEIKKTYFGVQVFYEEMGPIVAL